ncbi:MAG: hypothetical protein JXQ72_13595 [Anaerolineae bacterium]|nr:hypothetical protein [Anaerolineae bacterium]
MEPTPTSSCLLPAFVVLSLLGLVALFGVSFVVDQTVEPAIPQPPALDIVTAAPLPTMTPTHLPPPPTLRSTPTPLPPPTLTTTPSPVPSQGA